MTPEKKLVKAKSELLWTNPFFGALIVQLGLREASELHGHAINTMATDGKCIVYNRQFVVDLTVPELTFVLAHEVLHVAFLHHTRRQRRDPRRWNRAADYAINGELVECGFTMPTGKHTGLLDAKYTDLSAEEIYRLLDEEDEKNGGQPDAGEGIDPGGFGGVIDGAKAGDQAGMAEAEIEANIMVKQAATVARGKKAGSMSANLKRLIDTLTKPKIDWREQLRRFVDATNVSDYSFSRPNRRYLSSGLILPGTVPDGISHVAVAVDTSGSIDDVALTSFTAEIQAALDEGRVQQITAVYADSQVRHHETFEAGEQVVLDARGGGGTAFSDTMNWIVENVPDAVALCYMSDLYVSDFGEEPGMPVMWLCYSPSSEFEGLASRVPFGEAVHLDVAA